VLDTRGLAAADPVAPKDLPRLGSTGASSVESGRQATDVTTVTPSPSHEPERAELRDGGRGTCTICRGESEVHPFLGGIDEER
jgi:hypothetical protein